MPRQRRQFLTSEERERRIRSGFVLPPFGGGYDLNRVLIADGAEWSYRVKAWLLPDEATYQKWVRMAMKEDKSAGNVNYDPEDPYDRLSGLLGKKLKRSF